MNIISERNISSIIGSSLLMVIPPVVLQVKMPMGLNVNIKENLYW